MSIHEFPVALHDMAPQGLHVLTFTQANSALNPRFLSLDLWRKSQTEKHKRRRSYGTGTRKTASVVVNFKRHVSEKKESFNLDLLLVECNLYEYHFNGNDLARAVVSKAPKKIPAETHHLECDTLM